MAEYLRSRHAVVRPVLVRLVAWIIERVRWRNLPVMLTPGLSWRGNGELRWRGAACGGLVSQLRPVEVPHRCDRMGGVGAGSQPLITRPRSIEVAGGISRILSSGWCAADQL